MAAAQRARWAKVKQQSKSANGQTGTAIPGKRVISSRSKEDRNRSTGKVGALQAGKEGGLKWASRPLTEKTNTVILKR